MLIELLLCRWEISCTEVDDDNRQIALETR